MFKCFLITAMYFLPLTLQVWAGELTVGQTESEKYRYRMELANLILRKTASQYGASRLVPYSETDPSQLRCIRLLLEKEIDLVYMPPTEERLSLMDAIKYDIHNGMLGFRVLLIRKQDMERFRRVKTLGDLRKFQGGFGSQWADFKIFGLNNLPVVGSSSTIHLLKMLSAGRFDYFHRGLHEAWVEVETKRVELPNLMVEENLVLVYDFPVYFMFNKENPALKQRFEAGLKIILNDGSFKTLFLRWFKDTVDSADLKNRTWLRLKYPIPENLTPIDTGLWLNGR